MKGRYLPVFASEIVDQNQLAKSEGRPTINLKSVLIGNGITDISTYVFCELRIRWFYNVFEDFTKADTKSSAASLL